MHFSVEKAAPFVFLRILSCSINSFGLELLIKCNLSFKQRMTVLGDNIQCCITVYINSGAECTYPGAGSGPYFCYFHSGAESSYFSVRGPRCGGIAYRL